MKYLQVAPDVRLPVEILQDSTTIFGRKRMGKSNNAVVLVEEALALPLQSIIFDPKGDWWGITSSFDGKAAGYPLVVIGGTHGTPEIQLNPYAGTATADWVLDSGYSVIVDLSQLKDGDRNRFVGDFLETIRRRKTADPGPILIVVDEADELAPEDQRDRLTVIDAYRLIVWMVKRGGFAGIGSLCITQRPAAISKNVTTQSETIITLNVMGSQDLDAVSDALKHHVPGATKKERAAALDDLLREIVQLDKGAVVLVSAAARLKGTIHRIQFRRRSTFDSGATPKLGQKQRAPKVTAKVAIAQLSEAMAKAVAQVKANDPATLKNELTKARARIIELEKRPEKVAPPKRVEVPVLRAKDLARLERVLAAFDKTTSRFSGVTADMGAAVRPVYDAIKSALSAPPSTSYPGDGGAVRATAGTRPSGRTPVETPVLPGQRRTGQAEVPPATRTAPPSRVTNEGDVRLTKGHHRLLDTIAWLEHATGAAVKREAAAGLAGFSPTGGGLAKNLGDLVRAGLVTYPTPGYVSLTEHGNEVADAPEESLTAARLQEAVYGKIGSGPARLLQELVRIYPETIARDALAERVGFSPTGGGLAKNLGDLRGYGFIEYPAPGKVAAAPVLFLEGAA